MDEHPEVVSEYLTEEVEKGTVVGPVEEAATQQEIHVSQFGVFPKGHTTGKWRLIVNLSAPKAHSVNDGIDQQLCSLEYTSVDQAVQIISTLGRVWV